MEMGRCPSASKKRNQTSLKEAKAHCEGGFSLEENGDFGLILFRVGPIHDSCAPSETSLTCQLLHHPRRSILSHPDEKMS